ncbi:MAG: phosphotransferase family protein, partial [Acidimicrobiia bacterium]
MPALPLDESDFTARVAAALGREVTPVSALTGGASSLTYWATIVESGEKVVAKVCPPGLTPTRNRDMLRQARAQRALQGSAVPVPAVLAEDAGEPPEVPPFFVMEYAPGECVELSFLPPDAVPAPEQVRGRQLDTARFMGELHQIDVADLDLGGESESTLAQEVQRWTDSLDACDEDLRAGSEDVGERLLATIPDALPGRLLHGDFRTGNVLADEDRVTSVIDWEIWSIGDPRVDLGWFLIFVEDPRRTPPAGTPSVDELLETYQRSAGMEVTDLDWFRALVRYKQFSAGAFITRNARRRGAPVQPVDNSDDWLLSSA